MHSLCKEKLRSTQGPALIAYNDAVFQDTDWKALQRIYQSSKQGDTSYVWFIYPIEQNLIYATSQKDRTFWYRVSFILSCEFQTDIGYEKWLTHF